MWPRPFRRRTGVVRCLLAVLLVGALGCGALACAPTRSEPGVARPEAAPSGSAAPTAREDDGRPSCAAVVAALPVRARLAQRLVVGVDAAEPAMVVRLVERTQVGGVFVAGMATALLRDQALRQVQAVARIPVSVAVDDEGGRVQRVETLDGRIPSARRMAATMTPDEVRELARNRGAALAARGITVNYAPVVDLTGSSPAIGDRAFGSDPDTVTRYAEAFIAGMRDAGITTVLKHFPGHGRADGDSHRRRVTTPHLDELRRADLRPYTALVAPGGPAADGRTAVMVGHLDVPGLTDGLPTSLSPAAYRLLREEIGFRGLVLTDDLGAMKAVSARFDLPEAVVRALAAGADVALWSSGGRVDEILTALERALSGGRLDAGENDRAVARVLAAKGHCRG